MNQKLMAEFYKDIDVLLAKQLAGEANADELKVVESWLAESSENRAYFDGLKRLWQEAPQVRTGPEWEVDTEAALKKVKSDIQRGQFTQLQGKRSYRWMRAAAVLALMLAALWFLQEPETIPVQEIASSSRIVTDTLNDGSVVVLNRNSGLRIAENFNRKERRMRLSGEAYFQVAHDSIRPFVVEAEQLEITVVGTEFNVENKVSEGKVTVSVTSGKVLLKSSAQSALLLANEQAIFDITSKKIERIQKPSPNVLAYKTRVFSFDNTNLGSVIEQLNEVYETNISLKNKDLANCPLTTNFNNLPLDQILEIIAESFSLSIERGQDTIALDGEPCAVN